jgi:hypothetical protein
MRRYFFNIICPIFIINLIFAFSYAFAEVPDIVSQQKNSVVNIYVRNENNDLIVTGSGFIVDKSGLVVTNCDVIVKWLKEIPNSLVAETERGIQLPIENLISKRCDNNLALIKVGGKDLPSATIAENYTPRKGEDIFVFGIPSDLETKVTEGIVKDVLERRRLIQVSIPISPEKIGSPVFNNNGEVVAALTSLPRKGKGRHFAALLKNIIKQLNKYNKPQTELAKKTPLRIPSPVPKAYHRERETEKKREDFKECFLRGSSYQELDMYSEAIKSYEKAIELKPDFADAFTNLGIVYYKLAKYEEAIKAYKQAVRVNPDSTLLYNKIGSVYVIIGSYSKAIDNFKKATDIDPKDAISHYNLGIAYYLSGDRDSALSEYDVLKEIDKERAKSLIDVIY